MPVEMMLNYLDGPQWERGRSTWGPGPWNEEPDRILFIDPYTHYPCLIRRNMHLGMWCGYVGIPKGHPDYGANYNDVGAEVHGGLTFADHCDGDPVMGICHPSEPGEDHTYWLGFDCGHSRDYCPGLPSAYHDTQEGWETYRTVGYVVLETARLARRLYRRAEGSRAG